MKDDLLNPFSIALKLTEQQVWKGMYVGALRRCWGVMHGKRFPDQKSTEEKIWMNDLIGAIGENAVAVRYNIPWSGGTPGDTRFDVGGYQVKSTYWDHGRLLYKLPDRGADRPEDIFILVTCFRLPEVMFRGWCYGHEAKQPEFLGPLEEGRPCYSVPQIQLHNMLALPDPLAPIRPFNQL